LLKEKSQHSVKLTVTLAHSAPKKASLKMNRPTDYVKSKQRVADHGEVFTPASTAT